MLIERQKIIVVDDKYEEIEPFLSALWQKGIPCIYLNGQKESLPSEPFCGVRLIFLDIVLGTEGTSDKNKAAPVANVVKHIIGNNPSPYFIVFWTKHAELIDEVLRYLHSENISPVGYLCRHKLPKTDIKETSAEIMKEIESKFTELGAFDYLLTWENIVEKTAHNFSTNLFSSIPAKGIQGDWPKQVTSLMGSLALAYTEKRTLDDSENDIRNAFLKMTDGFRDNLQQTIKLEHIDYHTKLSDETIDSEQLAKINASLFFDFNPEKKPSFGNVFIDQNPDCHLAESLKKDIFPNSEKPDNVSIAGLIITPSCDIVHRKHLHNDKECFRVLYGLLIPIKNNSEYENYFKPAWVETKKTALIEELKNKDSDQKFINIVNKHFQGYTPQQSLFFTTPFWYSDKNIPCLLVFHFGSLTSVWWKNDEIPEFIFAIKEYLAFDIQSKMANHANRLGNSMLDTR